MRPLPSNGFHRLRRYYAPLRLLADPSASACGLVQSVAVAIRIGRGLSRSTPSCLCVPSLLPRESAMVHLSNFFPSRAAFAQLGRARPLRFLVTRLHLSSLRARPADSQLRACDPEHPGSASAGHLAVSRREPRYPFRSTFFGVNSFHFTRKASLRDAPKTPSSPREFFEVRDSEWSSPEF